jgi:type IV pilus assembly protein PilW
VKRQRGFSMVELMVAIVLALLLTGAVISVFIGSRSAYQATAGVGALSDSGRFALNLIGESVRSAGNLACNSAQSATTQNVVPGIPWISNYGVGIEGFEANGTAPAAAIALPAMPVLGAAANWTPNLDATMTAAIPATPQNFGQPVQGSDVLVVRSSVSRVATFYTTADVVPTATNLPVTKVPVAINAGGYAAVSDCTKSVIFFVPAAVAVGATAVTLNAGLPGVGFSAGAVVSPLTTTIYYIGVGSDGDSSLFRLEQPNGAPAFGAPEELVPDVENMQILYGIDTANTQTASAYVTANQVGAFNVVSIQVAVLVASPPSGKLPAAPPPYNMVGTQVTAPWDFRTRQVFYATINLRDAVN